MKKFNPVLKQDEYGYHYVAMEESPAGQYVLAIDAFENNPKYEYSFKKGKYVEKK